MSIEPVVHVGQTVVDDGPASFCGGSVAVYTQRAPDKDTPNEDGALIARATPSAGVLAVADGAGGYALGDHACEAALRALREALRANEAGEVVLREAILRGFEAANAAVQELPGGAATTLCAVEVDGRRLRSFHVGDSSVLVIGQRGRRKLLTVAHSPPGLAVEAGLMEEEEAIHDEERHVVLNMIGDPEMRIEMSGAIQLAPRDTVVLASDGLFDNLHMEEVIEIVRCGPLGDASRRLADAALARMSDTAGEAPSKPDDLTFVLFRPTASR